MGRPIRAAQRRGDAEAHRRHRRISDRPSQLPHEAATATSYLDYLHRANDALAEKGTWQQAFGDLFSNTLLTDLSYMETSDGQRFYVLGDIKRVDHKINTYTSTSFEAVNPSDVGKRMLVTVDPPVTLATPTPVLTPHAKMVSALNDELKTIDGNNWDTWGIDATDRIIKNKPMNVVVKAILIEQLLKTENAVADWAIGDVYAQAITELSREKPESLTWLDSIRVSAGTVKSLQGTMDALPPAAAIKDKLTTARTALFKMVSFDVTSTAVLLKDESNNWSVGSRTLATDGLLWTVPQPGAAGRHPFQRNSRDHLSRHRRRAAPQSRNAGPDRHGHRRQVRPSTTTLSSGTSRKVRLSSLPSPDPIKHPRRPTLNVQNPLTASQVHLQARRSG